MNYKITKPLTKPIVKPLAALLLSSTALVSQSVQANDLVSRLLTQPEYQQLLKADSVPYAGAIPVFDSDNNIHYAFDNNEGNIPFPEDITFKLNSKPWAKQTLYLDIHDYFYERLNTPFEFYDVDNSGGLSRAERRNLQAHYLSVVEAFSAFDINITTEDPGLDALLRTSVDDEYFGSRVILSDGKPPAGVTDISASGSPIYEIPTTEEPERPTFVYEIRSFSYHSGGGTNHEFGHTLGAVHIEPFNVGDRAVKHSTGKGETWWTGHMGTNQSGLVGHWLITDLSHIFRHGVITTADDHSDELQDATPLQTTNYSGHSLSHHGLIEDNQDIDVFEFTLDQNQYVEIFADTPKYVPKIDIELSLYNSDGEILEQHNAISHLDSVVFSNLEAGKYYVSVKGEGHAQSERHNGYFDFGSTGHYTLFLTQRDYVNTNTLNISDDRFTVLEEAHLTANPLENDLVSENATITWLGHSGAGAQRSANANASNQLKYNYHSQFGFGIFAAEDEILYRVEDNGQSAMGRIIVDVQSVADNYDFHLYAQVNDDQFNVLPNQINIIDPIHNDAPLKDYSINHGALTQPNNGQVVIRQDGKFEYTPTANFSGVDSFTYQLSMPGRSFSGHTGQQTQETISYKAKVTLLVSDGELIAGNDQRHTYEDIPVDVRVLDNDFSENGDLSITAFGQPSHGTVTKNVDNTLSYNPDQDYHGQDNFTYTVSDGQSEITRNVRIVLQATNDNPTAIADEYTIPANSSFTFNALSNDNDARDNASFFNSFANSQPEHGALKKNNSSGSFTYTPNKFYCGEDSFLYLIRDNLAGRNFSDVTFTIEGNEESCAQENDAIIKHTFLDVPDNFDFNQNIEFDIAFSSAVTGFDYSDLTLSHGFIERFEMIDDSRVHLSIAVDSQQDLTIQLKAGAVSNENGLSNSASEVFTLTYADTKAPDVNIITPENYRAGENITFVFKFTEPVVNFSETSLAYTDHQSGGQFISVTPRAEDFEKIDDQTYSIRMPATGTFVRLLVKVGSFADLAGNTQSYRVASVSRVTAPLATRLISIEPAAGQANNAAQQTFLVSFNKPHENLTAANFETSSTNANTQISAVESLANGRVYRVVIDVAANSDEELSLKLKGPLSGQGEQTSRRIDRRAPQFLQNNSTFKKLESTQLELRTTERIARINESAMTASNAAIESVAISQDGQGIIIKLTPSSLADVTLSFAQGAVQDVSNNDSAVSSQTLVYSAAGNNSGSDNGSGSNAAGNGSGDDEGTGLSSGSGGGSIYWLLTMMLLLKRRQARNR